MLHGCLVLHLNYWQLDHFTQAHLHTSQEKSDWSLKVKTWRRRDFISLSLSCLLCMLQLISFQSRHSWVELSGVVTSHDAHLWLGNSASAWLEMAGERNQRRGVQASVLSALICGLSRLSCKIISFLSSCISCIFPCCSFARYLNLT